MKRTIIIGMLCLSGYAIRAETVMPLARSLRVWNTQPDTLDYIFTSYTATPDGKLCLSLNHREGQTHFVEIGGMAGPFRVVAFDPFETSVFEPSINSWQTRKSGRVTLEDGEGRKYVLTQGEAMEAPGLRATVVSTNTGAAWNVRAGDQFIENGETFSVLRITSETVQIIHCGQNIVLTSIRSEEKARLTALWQEQEDQRRKQALAAQQERSQETKQQTSMDTETAAEQHLITPPVNQSEFFVGNEVPYPSEYSVLFVPQHPAGAWYPVILPQRFIFYPDGVWWNDDCMFISHPRHHHHPPRHHTPPMDPRFYHRSGEPSEHLSHSRFEMRR